MQITLGVRNIVIIAAVAAAAYFGYQHFYGGIETADIRQLLAEHRTAPSIKQDAIETRIVRLYQHDRDYGVLTEALDNASPVTQALAVQVLAAKREEAALPKFVEMLNDRKRDPRVYEQLAEVFRLLPTNPASIQAAPRLIELTDDRESNAVRIAANDALKEILQTGAQIKFGDGLRSRWAEYWEDHKNSFLPR